MSRGTVVGDAVRGAGDFVGGAVNIVKAPFDIAKNVVKGDIKGVGTTIKKNVGSIADAALPTGAAEFWRTDTGQNLLRNPTVDTLSLGYTGDAAGYFRGAGTLQKSGEISKEDLNSALRFGVKSAAAGAIGHFYGAPTGQQALTGSVIGNRAAAGDIRGAIGTFIGSDNPYFDSPDWLGQIGDNLARQPSRTPSPYESGYPLSTDSGFFGPDSGGKIVGISMLGMVAIVGAIYLARKRGVI